jgi:hypothetical protein
MALYYDNLQKKRKEQDIRPNSLVPQAYMFHIRNMNCAAACSITWHKMLHVNFRIKMKQMNRKGARKSSNHGLPLYISNEVHASELLQ